MLWELMGEFVLRLCFGLAVAMAWTPANMVSGGFFKVHCWVLLGLNTFAALAVRSIDLPHSWLFALSITAAGLSYVGAVLWMYEWKKPGMIVLYLIALLDLIAALFVASTRQNGIVDISVIAQVVGSGMVLGLTMCAMLLGHWYLNAPGMKLEPLKQLILWLIGFVVLRSLVCGSGLAGYVGTAGPLTMGWYGLVALRWLSGLIGILVLAWMTWETLKIPNTQSATGILYVAVIFSFLGELSSQLLASSTAYPL